MQILNSKGFTKTQKSRCLKNELSLFFQVKKKIINYTSRATFMVNNSFVVEVTFRNIGERSTAKNYHPFSFLSVF